MWLIRPEDVPIAHRVEFLARSMARSLQFTNSPCGLRQCKLAASRTLPLAKTGTPGIPPEFAQGTSTNRLSWGILIAARKNGLSGPICKNSRR